MYTKCYKIEFSKFAAKQIEKLPKVLKEAILLWKMSVEEAGMPEVRKLKGYHDEPLKGRRVGQRSVRLNRAYRLIYAEFEQGEVVIVGVQEVNKHEY
jgi:proteic killer suppression protein